VNCPTISLLQRKKDNLRPRFDAEHYFERSQHQRAKHRRLSEAVVAAQSDAQSALSQEQVPRAYQGAVRDYFDDLKK
jgi:hypothetical protein